MSSFCGCEGFQLIANFFESHTGVSRFFSRCFLELVVAYALYFSVFTFLSLWLVAFRCGGATQSKATRGRTRMPRKNGGEEACFCTGNG